MKESRGTLGHGRATRGRTPEPPRDILGSMGSQAAYQYLIAAARKATTSFLEQLAVSGVILTRAKLLPVPIHSDISFRSCDARRASLAATGQSMFVKLVDRRASRSKIAFVEYCRSVASRLGTFI